MTTHETKEKPYRSLQTNILFTITIEGRPTKYTMLGLVKADRSSLSKAVKSLLKKQYISFQEEKPPEWVTRTAKKFYMITDSGLESLSKDSALTQEQFWNIVFHVYEVKTVKTRIPFKKFISNYEKHVLGFDLENTPIDLEVTLRDLSFTHPVSRIEDSGIPMLIILTTNKPMSEDNVIKYLKQKNPLKTKIDKSNLETSFNRLLQDKLIAKLSDDENPQYRITVLGYLTVMKFLGEFQNEIVINTDLIVKKIIKNSKIEFTFISEPWDTLRKITNETKFLDLINDIINKRMTVSQSIQTGGVNELLSIERNMTQTHIRKIKNEAITGSEVQRNLVNDGIIQEGFSSQVRKRLLFLLIISGVTFQGKEKIIESVKGKDFSLEADVERIVCDTISFEFFILLLDFLIDMKKNNARLYLIKIQKWNQFQKSNKKFREWFDNWKEHLTEFEERNVQIIKERPFLKV